MRLPLAILTASGDVARPPTLTPLAVLEQGKVRVLAWDEGKHPRHPAGSSKGGEFAPKFTHRVVSDRFGVSSEHTSEELARKAAERLQRMSGGKLPEGTFRVEAIPVEEQQQKKELALPFLKARLDALEARGMAGLREALEDCREALVTRVRRTADLAGLVRDMRRLPFFRAVESEVRAMLDRAWEAGRKDARREVRSERRLAFNPNQPRHPAGSDKGGEWIDVHHGTAEENAEAILKEGLVVKKENRTHSEGFYRGPRGSSVFVSSKLGHAEVYAKRAAFEAYSKKFPEEASMRTAFGGKLVSPSGKLIEKPVRLTAVVFHFRLPPSVAAGLKIDGQDINSFYSPKSLDAKHIVGYTTIKFTEGDLSGKGPREWRRTTKLAEEVGEDFYVVVLVPEGEERHFAGADSSFSPRAAARWLRAHSFWVSGILGERVLADAKREILSGLKSGKATEVIAESVMAVFLPYLGDEDVIADEKQLEPYRLETIVRTNTTTAYNHGRLTEFLDPDIVRFLKGVRYAAILDERTTEVCRFLDGKIFKPNSPDLEALLPPNHFQCRSVVTPIVAGEPVQESDFITPAQVGRARSLADAKFLSQTHDAWAAYRERADDEAGLSFERCPDCGKVLAALEAEEWPKERRAL